MDLREFDSFTEQRQADIQYYRSLSPQERLQIFLQLQRVAYGPEETWPVLRENIHLKIRSSAT